MSRPCWIWAPALLAALYLFKAKNKDWSVVATSSLSQLTAPRDSSAAPCPCRAPRAHPAGAAAAAQAGAGGAAGHWLGQCPGRALGCQRGWVRVLGCDYQHSREEHEPATLTGCPMGQPCPAQPRAAQAMQQQCRDVRVAAGQTLLPQQQPLCPGPAVLLCLAAVSNPPCSKAAVALPSLCLRLFLL